MTKGVLKVDEYDDGSRTRTHSSCVYVHIYMCIHIHTFMHTYIHHVGGRA